MTENAQRNREAEVNLLAAAREAQWSAAAFMGPNTMKLVSPAKVNLLLAIGARREDGYHDADAIMHALALHDTLYLCAEDISADELAKRTAEGASREDVAVGGPADNLVMTIDLADRTGQDLAVPAAEALLPELPSIREWLAEQAGSESVLLSGSGSATFALVDTFAGASRIATAATAHGWWARPTSLSGLRAAVVPGR